MKLYLLYYDTDHGSREEWNTFYTPCEVFDCPKKRQARIEFLKLQVADDGTLWNYDYHTIDTKLMTDEDIQKWHL